MNHPHVSIVTPVYNGEAFLAECIESVVSQNYRHFDYTIVDNCSTDGTLKIAQSYVARDPRLRVLTNTIFVGAIDNHNRALRAIRADAKYCKVVSADDWITPDCVGKMVALAEAHPSVVVAGCYQHSGATVKWRGVPTNVDVLAGRDAARLGLLQGIHVLGTPTSVFYRADVVRMRDEFYPHPHSHADASACYEAFQHGDFGFVHEELAFERVHAEQWTTAMDALDAGSLAYLDLVMKYGPWYLDAEEFITRKRDVFDGYYRALGGCLLKLKGPEYWTFHKNRFGEMGCKWQWNRILWAAFREAVREGRQPHTALRKVQEVFALRIAKKETRA